MSVEAKACPCCGVKDIRYVDTDGSLDVCRQIGIMCRYCGHRVMRYWDGHGDIYDQLDDLVTKVWNQDF